MDYKKVLTAGDFFAKQGKKVVLTPRVHFKNPLYKGIYGDLIGTPYERKCPDLKIDNHFYEHEGFINVPRKRTLGSMLTRGLKQASKLIIEDDGSKKNHILKTIKFRKKEGQVIDELWIKKDDVLHKFYP